MHAACWVRSDTGGAASESRTIRSENLLAQTVNLWQNGNESTVIPVQGFAYSARLCRISIDWIHALLFLFYLRQPPRSRPPDSFSTLANDDKPHPTKPHPRRARRHREGIFRVGA